METVIVECPKCGVRNRIGVHPDGLMRPICGRCGAGLYQHTQEQTGISRPKNAKFNAFVIVFLMALLVAVSYGIVVTPSLMYRDFSLLSNDEAQQTELLKKQYENELATIKASLENELAAIDAKALRQKATEHYTGILDARKSYDKRYALSPREKAQLRMRNLASDSAKSFHDAILAVAREASPDGANIRVHESARGIALHIDFDMSSMTLGEYGTRTKHHTKESLRKEVVALISRVTNDIFQFCRDLDLASIHVGCRHYVQTKNPYGATRDENMVLYKVRIRKERIPQLTSNPFLDIYSTAKYFEVDQDNFDGIEIITSRT